MSHAVLETILAQVVTDRGAILVGSLMMGMLVWRSNVLIA